MENKSFEDLYNKNVSEFVEKKGKFNYLSWAFAVKELKKAYPEATYIQIYNEQNKPYFTDESGCYIRVKLFLTKQDRKDDFYQDFTHPVLDNQNKTVLKPNSFQINTSFMRGLTKLIGMCTGIGLYIYAGEDLLEIDKEAERLALEDEKKEQEKAKKWNDFFDKMEQKLKDNPFDSLREYTDFIYSEYTKKTPSLIENKRFKALEEQYRPKPEIRENKAKQTIDKVDKCNTCTNTAEFCVCDIDSKVLANV